MVNIGPLAAEICWRVLGTPANFNGFRVLEALLHVTLVVVLFCSLAFLDPRVGDTMDVLSPFISILCHSD